MEKCNQVFVIIHREIIFSDWCATEKYHNYSVDKSQRFFSERSIRQFCFEMMEHNSWTNRNIVSRYRRKLLSAGLSRLFLTTGDLSLVMDERTQTLPTAQYRTEVRGDMDTTRAIRNVIRFRVYVSTTRYCHTKWNKIAAGNM